MKHPKDETLSIRTSAEIKQLLRMAADHEHRSVTSMVEVLILAYAKQHDLKVKTSTTNNRTDKQK
jgi:uncharacterized protein (DUF1778 family)